MKITRDEVIHVSNLARLDLDEAAISKFVDQIGTIMSHVDSLKKVATEGVIPTSHAIALTNAFREDEVTEHLDREAGLANAPEKDEGAFIVPRVIE
jgi:aspartyl-tRNA(Asn)/glutamyl-tRNA(Gln) amidotransferase subunit C